MTITAKLSVPATTDLGKPEGLAPIFPARTTPSLAAWPALREDILRRWQAVLGHPEPESFDRTPERVRQVELPWAHAEEYLLPTSPTSRQRAVLLRPLRPSRERLPVAVVPFYHPEAMVGFDLAKGEALEPTTVQFGRHLVQQGFMVLCGQAFPFNTVPDPGTGASFDWWRAAARALLERHPHWTGMGRLIHDTRIAIDFLLGQPDADAERVLIIGHSLGGKMAFYNGCLDRRITAIVASDFGIGFSFTNWQDPWYLGTKVLDPALPVRHHELLAAACPCPFLIVAGQYDGPASWQYLNAARPVYALHGRAEALGMIDHASGHRPPASAMQTAYQWLAEQFGLPAMAVAI
ncbi:MAG: acetylxylan esterase [Lentisphaerae bacterium]|nr:acetylxylan esterase [Lentisphaerota bacterium]